jgi:hypothetical protein
MSRPRRIMLGLGIAVGLGLCATVASAAISSQLTPSPDRYQGHATVRGYPWPYQFSVEPEPGSATMTFQVHYTLALVCGSEGPGPLCGDGTFLPLPFAFDWAIWSLGLGTAMAAIALLRRRRSPMTASIGSR